MSSLLTLPPKQTAPLNYGPQIKEYIVNTQIKGQKAWEEYIPDANTLNEYRKEAEAGGVEKLERYFGQLSGIAKKLPFDETHIVVKFGWTNAFEAKKGKFIWNYNAAYELACVAFNIASAYSHLGHETSLSDSAGVKLACKHMQKAAGYMTHITETYGGELNRIPAPDMAHGVLISLHAIMIAQAQELAWLCAVMEGKLDNIISKLACKTAEFYESAYEKASPNIKLLGQGWLTQLLVKSCHFRAASEYRRALEDEKEEKMGDGVARLHEAIRYVKRALDHEHLKKFASAQVVADLKSLQNIVMQKIPSMEKFNDVVFHQMVPTPEKLPKIVGIELVASVPPVFSSAVTGPTLFSKLVSADVNHAVRKYEERKEQVLKAQTDKVNQSNSEANNLLNQLNLPGAIQAYEQPKGLPAELLARSEHVRSLGGSRSLADQIMTVLTMGAENKALLEEMRSILQQEEQQDSECRSQFGNRWPRKPSRELTANFWSQLEKHEKTLQLAAKGDDSIKTNFDGHMPYIESLSATRSELEASIPASTLQTKSSHNLPQLQRLKDGLAELERIRARTNQILEGIKQFSSTDEVGQKFTQLACDSQNAEAIIDQELEKFAEQRSYIDTSLVATTRILQQIENDNKEWIASKHTNTDLQEREIALKQLNSAYQQFKTLTDNIDEGIRFHTSFKSVLELFRDTIKDFVFARTTEKKDYLHEIQQASASTSSETPSLPPRAVSSQPFPVPSYPDSSAPPASYSQPAYQNSTHSQNYQQPGPYNQYQNMAPSYSVHQYATGPPQFQSTPNNYSNPNSNGQYSSVPQYQGMPMPGNQSSPHGGWTPDMPAVFQEAPNPHNTYGPPK